MREKDILIDFARSLVEAPLTIVFLLLDVLGVAALVVWVIDDLQEAMVMLIFIAIVLGGQYLVFRGIRLQLAKYEQAKPNIEFSKVRQAQMYVQSPLGGKMPSFEVLQVWFKNNPTLPLESTIAKNVTALVKIQNADSSEVCEFHGQWAEANAPDNVGYDGYHDMENIQPSHIESKLMIALKYPSDTYCYAFSREGLRSTSDGRSSRYQISPGEYLVKIHLRGVGVDDIFYFQLQNNGANQNMKMEPKFS